MSKLPVSDKFQVGSHVIVTKGRTNIECVLKTVDTVLK